MLLSKKVPLDESVKSIALNTHSYVKTKGSQFIPEESQLIQFNELLDQKCLVKMGEQRRSIQQEIISLVDQEMFEGKISPTILRLIKMKFVV